jgi:hypothetical protein
MNLKYFFIKDYVEDGQLEVRSIGTNDMIADVLSKPLVGEQFIAVKHQSDTTSPKIV